MFIEHKVLLKYNNCLCRANIIERLDEHQFAVVTLDHIYEDNVIKNILDQKKYYSEQVIAEIDSPFLAWFPSIQDALDDFLDGEW
ncbi:MAG: hypothetical protein J6578_09795 [Snodgrassella sp.]|uniref:hypothetical protein n=1 Tax=Snodgrassella sp. TaxID=2815304 RepID=UPI002584D71B|nr:hypothetical protein [Snodgrassella sp.]MCO6509058.1 hypothetical protein [Snodgrassella sp.]